MKVVLGLGNPGGKYAKNRHNAGVLLVDRIFNFQSSVFNQTRWDTTRGVWVAKFPEIILVKTAEYYMNESGKMVQDLNYLNLELGELYLAHDDLDIKLGEYKLQKGKSPKIHNGVISVEQAMGTKDFFRIRVGIENRTFPVEGERYVLEDFLKSELEEIEKVFEKIISELKVKV